MTAEDIAADASGCRRQRVFVFPAHGDETARLVIALNDPATDRPRTILTMFKLDYLPGGYGLGSPSWPAFTETKRMILDRAYCDEGRLSIAVTEFSAAK